MDRRHELREAIGSLPELQLPRTPLQRLLESRAAGPEQIEGLIKLYTTVSPLTREGAIEQ